MRLRRSLGVAVAAWGLMVTANPVAADSRTINVFDLPFFRCTANTKEATVPPGVATEGAVHVCFVRFFSGVPWQAEAGEWIFFNWKIFLNSCADGGWTGTATMTLDGSAVPVDTLPCQATPLGASGIGLGYLSHPLPPGDHTATLTLSPAPPAPNTPPQPVTVTVVQGDGA